MLERSRRCPDFGGQGDREGAPVPYTPESQGDREGAPLPYTGAPSRSPWFADIRSLLPKLAASLRDKTLDEALNLVCSEGETDIKGVFGYLVRPVLCGLEIALLDALGKAEGCAVSALLSPAGIAPRARVPVNAVIGARAKGAAIVAAQEARKHGYRCVKLKVALGDSISEEVERVEEVRAAIGPGMHLRLDANEGWQLEQAIAILSQCDPYEIQYVEQPLKAHDLAGMRTLRRTVSIPIAVDEALHGLESAQRILANEAADIFVIKPQLAGGLRAGQQMIAAAAERGVRSVITSTLEAGIGLVAALHLAAAAPAVTLECGLATLGLLVDDLVMDDLIVREGFLAVPTGPGLGIALDRQSLHSYAL